MDLHQILVTDTYPPYLQTIFLLFFNDFLHFFFFFVNIGPYGTKNSNDISSVTTHQIHSEKSCIVLGRISTKVVQRIVKFEILDDYVSRKRLVIE